MKILNSKSYRNVILGRDFLSKFSNVQFDFKKQRVKLGYYWHSCMKLNQPSVVLLAENIELPARTESVVIVKCKPSHVLITADFEPLPVARGVYATHCRVVPSIRDVFQIKLLNVNNKSYLMNRERKIRSLNKIEEMVASVEHFDSKSSATLESNIVYGDNLSVEQKAKTCTLVSEYRDVFSQNSKKPNWSQICNIISSPMRHCQLNGNHTAFPMLGIQKLTNKSRKC